MSEWWKIWANGLPIEDLSPKSGYRMAVEGLPFPWRWNGGTISAVLEFNWGMSDKWSCRIWTIELVIAVQSILNRAYLVGESNPQTSGSAIWTNPGRSGNAGHAGGPQTPA